MTILQQAFATAAIALSAFNLITYLWLGLTVLLLGNRRARVTWVGGAGLLVAALFFLCHGALVGAGAETGAGPVDFWWRLSWLPAFAAPACWAAIGLHYVGLSGTWSRLRKLAVAGLAALAATTVLLAFLNWGALNSYGDFLRLLAVVLTRQGHTTDPTELRVLASPALSALAVAFVAYVGACACLPWASLVARRLRAPGPPSALGVPASLPSSGISAPMPAVTATSATGATPTGGESGLLWDVGSAWSQARRALIAASLCMIVAGAVVGVVGIITSVAAHGASRPHGSATALPAAPPLPGHLPLALVVSDLVVQSALAGLVLMLGWAVVRQGILVERRLPQRGFLAHWRGTVIVASIVAALVAWLTLFDPESLPVLLILVTGMTSAYALFTWRSYAAHDAFLAQLRPFVDSLGTSSAGWIATSPREVERAVEALFTSLCRDVLEASRGRLALSAGHLHRTFRYQAPEAASWPAGGREWVLPVADERGVVARLALGPRLDGAGYTSADLEIARACGQRILDAVGEFTAVRTIAQLARKRGLEAELSAALPRRKIHDEVLPKLHLAMLRLEALRGRAGATAGAAGATSMTSAEHAVGVTASATAGGAIATTTPMVDLAAALSEVVSELGGVHRELAAVLRATPTAAPRRLARGFCAALEAALDGEMKGAFDALVWEAPDPARGAADTLPDITADLLLGATREALRNASRHGRGGDLHRPLEARVTLEADDQAVTVRVTDDGVGLQPGAAVVADLDGAQVVERVGEPSAGAGGAGGARSGLLTHSALLALVGGSLAAQSGPEGGTTVTLRVPRAAGELQD